MKIARATLVLLIGLGYPAFSWNGTGHKTVAFIAYSNLTPKARARVDQLLAKHPMVGDFNQISDPSEDPGRVVFVNFATWPDFIRSDESFVDTPRMDALCHPNGTAPPAPVPVFPGFPDMQRHQDWHFFDTPLSADGTATHPVCSPNAQTQLDAFIHDLQDSSKSDPVKTFELPWVLHLTGDVHQPLHAVTRFSKALPAGDRGGNSVKLANGSNLHAFWDDVLGKTETEEFIARLATAIMDANPKTSAAQVLVPQMWISESAGAAQKDVYMFMGTGSGHDLVTLSALYKARAKTVARQRVALAGYRLANVLNQLFQ
jgi:S1/P1 nuclease